MIVNFLLLFTNRNCPFASEGRTAQDTHPSSWPKKKCKSLWVFHSLWPLYDSTITPTYCIISSVAESWNWTRGCFVTWKLHSCCFLCVVVFQCFFCVVFFFPHRGCIQSRLATNDTQKCLPGRAENWEEMQTTALQWLAMNESLLKRHFMRAERWVARSVGFILFAFHLVPGTFGWLVVIFV